MLKKIITLLLTVVAIYVATSIFAFLLSIVVNTVRDYDPKLWLLIMPLLVVGFLMMIYLFDLGRFLRIFIYTNIGLGLKSILLTLYYDLCNIEWNHTATTRNLTVFILVLTALLVVLIYKKKGLKINEIALAMVSVVVFEVAARDEYLSIVFFLNRLF